MISIFIFLHFVQQQSAQSNDDNNNGNQSTTSATAQLENSCPLCTKVFATVDELIIHVNPELGLEQPADNDSTDPISGKALTQPLANLCDTKVSRTASNRLLSTRSK